MINLANSDNIKSCRKIFDEFDLEKSENASLLMSRYVKTLGKNNQDSIDELFFAIKESAFNVKNLYSKAFNNRQKFLNGIAQSKIFETKSLLIAGLGGGNVLESGLALNPTYGLPILPASSIKGITANYCSKFLGAENPDYKAPEFDKRGKPIKEAGKIYSALFGKIYPKEEQESGFLRFYDAWIIPTEKMSDIFVDDVMTPHNTKYYETGDTKYFDFEDPVPIKFLAVKGKFEFWIDCQEPDEKARKNWIDFAFKILEAALNNYGIGGKLNSGYGKMEHFETEEERNERLRREQSEKNREAGFIYNEGEILTVICKKFTPQKGKRREKREFNFAENPTEKRVQFQIQPKISEGETVRAVIERIDKVNNAFMMKIIE